MTYEHLIYEKEGHVVTITLNQPEKLNALSSAMRCSFVAALAEAAEDVDTRVVVLTGSGRGFCSGADLTGGGSGNAADYGLGESYRLEPLGMLALKLNKFAKPTIAAVNGVAAGGGLGLALGCDIRISSENARYSSVFVRRALGPDHGVSYLLPRLVGLDMALRLMYTGDIIDAQEALRIGLTSQVVPVDQLMSVAYELAHRLAKGPPVTLSLTKKAAYHGLDGNFYDALEYETYAQNIIHNTEDSTEGRRAFVEKREPQWKGR